MVLLIAIAYSKRDTGSMTDGPTATDVPAEAEAGGASVMAGDRNATLRQAIDLWIDDLGHEDKDLRTKLLEVRESLPTPVVQRASRTEGPVVRHRAFVVSAASIPSKS